MSFKNDPILFTYVYTSEEPEMALQFGIQEKGAVIYKPKRNKFKFLLELSPPGSPNVEPAKLKTFVDNAMDGSGDGWKNMWDKNEWLVFHDRVENAKKDDL